MKIYENGAIREMTEEEVTVDETQYFPAGSILRVWGVS